MIEPVLPPECYSGVKWYDLECKEIFGKLWLLVGLRQQLDTHDSFITRQFNGVSVLVQNIQGELRAFRNVCAHRGMPIQTEPFGVRKLVCPYHGWGYREDGSLRGIANAAIYGICDARKASIRLHSYPLEIIGDFVFVNLASEPLAITEQYSPDMIAVLTAVSASFGTEVSFSHFTCDYNWKLNFENVLDWNHVQFVHPQSLGPLLADKSSPASYIKRPSSLLFGQGALLAGVQTNGAIDLNVPVALQDLSIIGRKELPYAPSWFSGLMEAPCDQGAFLNCKLFPNANFVSVHGEQFYLEQFVPVSPDRIDYHSWVFTSRLKKDVPVQPQLLWWLHHSEKRVIDEDAVLLTALHASLKSASCVGVMGDHEGQLVAMGQWYLQRLSEGGNQ